LVAIAIVVLLVLIGLAGSVIVAPNSGDSSGSDQLSTQTGGAISSTSSTGSSASEVLPASWLSQDPSFQGGNAAIDYPANYSLFANFTLGLINRDRASAGLPPVGLSAVASGQQHADSMAVHGYFSHWDPQGYKPYMRYTLLNGTGAVSENIALDYCSSAPSTDQGVIPTECTVRTLENALNDSEWGMMNNDLACCNNGHRDNILNPAHNLVSIGVAYNTTESAVYLVEDFETNLLGASFSVQGTNVTLTGHSYPGFDATNASILVTFDSVAPLDDSSLGGPSQSSTCTTITSGQMTSTICPAQVVTFPICRYIITPTIVSLYGETQEGYSFQVCPPTSYTGSYDAGSPVGAVFGPCQAPPGYYCFDSTTNNEIAAYASSYVQLNDTQGTFTMQFSLGQFVDVVGSGVYTLYFLPGDANDTSAALTSYSVFVGSP
jgi:uncharacterized protein YkwD